MNLLKAFLSAYKDLEETWKFSRFERWMSGQEAEEYLQTAHERFFLFVLPMQRMEARIEGYVAENRELRVPSATEHRPGSLCSVA